MFNRCLRAALYGTAMLVTFSIPSWKAEAAGALALGMTDNLARDGVGITGLPNQPDRETAVREALKSCKESADSPAAGAACKIVATFSGQCFAFSGAKRGKDLVSVGWGVAPSEKAATTKAIALCRKNAPKRYRSLCAPGFSSCDPGG
jgi:hypothetical protein